MSPAVTIAGRWQAPYQDGVGHLYPVASPPALSACRRTRYVHPRHEYPIRAKCTACLDFEVHPQVRRAGHL